MESYSHVSDSLVLFMLPIWAARVSDNIWDATTKATLSTKVEQTWYDDILKYYTVKNWRNSYWKHNGIQNILETLRWNNCNIVSAGQFAYHKYDTREKILRLHK